MNVPISWNGESKLSCLSLSRPSYSASRGAISTTSLLHQTLAKSWSRDGSMNSTQRLPFLEAERSSPSSRRRISPSEGIRSGATGRKWDWKHSFLSRVCLSLAVGRRIASFLTYSETWLLSAPTRSGARTSRTFGWPTPGMVRRAPVPGCTSWLSWTGTADTSLPGR